MQGLTPLHSYDPFQVIKVIFDALFGAATSTSGFGGQIHDNFALFFHNLPFYIINIFARYAVFSFLVSIVMFIIVIIYARRYRHLRKKMIDSILPTDTKEEKLGDVKDTGELNPKWKIVDEHIHSDDPNKWKLAIIEADIILNDLLDSLNLPGDTIGEKLKAVDTSDFRSIEDAWEAHKIRNAIAHEGSEFLINEREAQRVIGLYEKVFSEFEMI